MALTATATPRVRKDIIHQLGMRNPKWFVYIVQYSHICHVRLVHHKSLYAKVQLFLHFKGELFKSTCLLITICRIGYRYSICIGSLFKELLPYLTSFDISSK